ncbi:MAG: DUF4203 domain-containing protein [Anaerolineaceae bacterium]|nr:DUF4203 domain-containing protein [Anaerolineaceae bacterium]
MSDTIIEHLSRLTPATIVCSYAAFGTFWGLAMMFFGYRYYRLMSVITGAGLGAAMAVTLCSLFITAQQPIVLYLVGLVGAGIGAVVYFYVYTFLFGFTLGGTVAVAASLGVVFAFDLKAEGLWYGMIGSVILMGLMGGGLALVFRRFFWIFITSTGGAALAVLSAAAGVGNIFFIARMQTLDWILAACGFAVLGVTGLVVQIRTSAAEEEADETAKKKPRHSSDKKSRKASRRKSKASA